MVRTFFKMKNILHEGNQHIIELLERRLIWPRNYACKNCFFASKAFRAGIITDGYIQSAAGVTTALCAGKPVCMVS